MGLRIRISDVEPGFHWDERVPATLPGFARTFCMRSIHHRGTEGEPGLVLALDPTPGTSCRGLAFRVRVGEEGATLMSLRERELISSAYVEETLSIALDDGREVRSAGLRGRHHTRAILRRPRLETQAQISRGGGRPWPEHGIPLEYGRHLRELGIEDTELVWLSDRVRAFVPESPVGMADAAPNIEVNKVAGAGPGMARSDRETVQQFSQPVRAIVSMVIVLILVGVGAWIAFPSVAPVFLANKWLNGAIAFVFTLGSSRPSGRSFS